MRRAVFRGLYDLKLLFQLAVCFKNVCFLALTNDNGSGFQHISVKKSLQGRCDSTQSVGRIDENNVGEFLKNGFIGVGVGSSLYNKELIKRGEYDKLEALARKYVAALK